MAIGAILSIVSTGLEMLDKHIDDPVRKLRAMQEYIDECKNRIEGILSEEDIEKLDRLLLDFISTIHNL